MSLFKSVAAFGGFTLISRLTGFLRDMVLAVFLGAGLASDAFFVAFKLPNLFRSLFAEGAFTTAFVPMLSHKLVQEKRETALNFAARSVSVLAFFVAVFVLLMEIFMPWVVDILAPGFANDPGKVELAASLSRITFPFLLFISIVSFQSGILNSFDRFAAPAAAPVILNLVMIIAVFVSMPFGISTVQSVAIGVALAGFLEILWLSYFLRQENVRIRPCWNIIKLLKDSDIRTLFKRIAPGVLGAGIYQINMVVDTIIVSLVGTGAISWLYYANRLQQLPLGVVGAAISVALLPILSHYLKADAVKEAEQTQNKAVEYGAMLSFPAAVALVVLAVPTVNLLFQHGKFGALETAMTAQAVIAYAVGLPAYVLVKALAPNFFARGDTRTPVKYSVIVLGTNIIFSLLLMKPFGHVGIAAATTIAAFVSLYQYCRGLKKRGYWQFSEELRNKIYKIAASSLTMGGILWLGTTTFDLLLNGWLKQGLLIKLGIFGILCVLGVASFGIMAKITGVLNVAEIRHLLSKKGKKDAPNQA